MGVNVDGHRPSGLQLPLGTPGEEPPNKGLVTRAQRGKPANPLIIQHPLSRGEALQCIVERILADKCAHPGQLQYQGMLGHTSPDWEIVLIRAHLSAKCEQSRSAELYLGSALGKSRCGAGMQLS